MTNRNQQNEELSIWKKSWQSGVGGAVSMGINVTTLMWMRTIMNVQYRHGGTVKYVVQQLYKEGGIPRFYRGYTVAMMQGPLSRFGDTFSNTFALRCLDPYDNIPLSMKTGLASLCAATFRLGLMPLDTLKTTFQVEGKLGSFLLWQKTKQHGVQIWFHGAGALFSATAVGHYPWFLTYNLLNAHLPFVSHNQTVKKHGRNALIGFVSSIVSDTVSNSLRVVKTWKQTHEQSITYPRIISTILQRYGWKSLFGRGLPIRLFTNGIQGLVFTVLWKSLSDDDHNK